MSKNDYHDRLSFNYGWPGLLEQPDRFRAAVREFLDNGVRRFVINSGLLKQMVESQEKADFLHQICKEMDVEFCSVHALDGNDYDLDIPTPERRPAMFRDHIRAMEIASGFGCPTYTIHVGAAFYCYKHIPLTTLRPLALETLEKLLPTAEKLGMVIAVENSFEKPNSAREVIGLVNHFAGNPAIGVCYDTGHAHCMASAPGKDKSKYEPYFPVCWWENGVEWEDDALELLQDQVVTCHIHDNNGYGDLHGMPFDGTIDWRALMPKLFACPRMIDFQTEVCMKDGQNWAGKLLAPPGGYSIRRMVDTFRYLGF